MPHILNSAISNHRDPKASCILRYLENSSGLWSAHRHNLLSDAYGASSHANPQCIYSGIDKVLCLCRRYHITANHLQIWVTLFYKPRKSDLLKIINGSMIKLLTVILITYFHHYDLFDRTCSRLTTTTRGIKVHVYRKRQTSDSSWEFLKIENKQIKAAPNDSHGQNWHKTTCFV